MLLLAQRLRRKTHLTQRLRKVRGKTVQRENAFRRDAFHELNEVGKIRVVAQRKCGVGLVTKAAIRIHRPAGQHRGARLAQLAQRRRQVGHRRTNQHFPARRLSFELLVRRKLVAELFKNFRELENRFVQENRQPGIGQPAQEFLAFAERIAEQHRRLLVVDGFPTEANHAFQHLARWRELILGPAISRLHDERVRVARLARFGGQARPQLEIAGVKHDSFAARN